MGKNRKSRRGGRDVDQLLRDVARHGVVYRDEAKRAGVTRHEIDDRVGGLLIADGNGTYRLAGAARFALTAERAALGASRGLAIGLWSAMPRCGVQLEGAPDAVHVLTDASSSVKETEWYRVHGTRRLPRDDELVYPDGMPVTTPLRVIRDFAAFLPFKPMHDRQIDSWVEESRLQGAFEVDDLLEMVLRERGNKVKKRLKDLHARHVGISPQEFKSIGERWLRDLIERMGLPMPQFNVRPPGAAKDADAYYPHIPLIIEFDGYSVHSQRGKFHRDRAGDRRMLVTGKTPTLRITKWDFDHDLAQLERDIVELVSNAWFARSERAA